MLTTTIKGLVFLAKRRPCGVSALTYVNLTQAQTAADKVGGCVFRFPGGRPIYVLIKTQQGA